MSGTTHIAMQASTGGRAARPPGAVVRVPPLADSRGNEVTGRWPLVNFLELGALPGAVPCARLHVRQVLWEWGLEASAETIELLVSELVTNAVLITRAVAADAPVRLWLVSDETKAVIWVWDASPLPPQRTEADGLAEHGRGLMLVQVLSVRWGWAFPPRTGGKAVWAECALEAPGCIPGSAGRNSEVIPGSVAYPASKDKGDCSMPLKRRPGPGIRDGVPQDPRNTVKAKLPEPQSPVD